MKEDDTYYKNFGSRIKSIFEGMGGGGEEAPKFFSLIKELKEGGRGVLLTSTFAQHICQIFAR